MNLLLLSLSGGVLILFILVLRLFLGGRIPHRTFSILWKLAVLRLFLPVSIPIAWSSSIPEQLSGETVPDFIPKIPLNIIPGGAVSEASPVVEPAAEAAGSIPVLMLVWAAGAILLALFLLGGHLKNRLAYRTALPFPAEKIKEWQRSHPLWRKIRVRSLEALGSPLTYGIFRPVILLPSRIEDDLLPFVLTHEYIHIRRLDVAFKWLMAAALCLHWFNPLVWLLCVFAGRDLEISCDEAVIGRLGRQFRSKYALALVQLEERRLFLLSTAFNKHLTAERIEKIMKNTKASPWRILAAVMAVAAVSLVISVTCLRPEPSVAAEQENSIPQSTESQIESDLKEENSLPGEEDTAESDMTYEESVVAQWNNVVTTEADWSLARELCVFVLEQYGLSESNLPSDNNDLTAAMTDGTLFDKTLEMLCASAGTAEDDFCTRVQLSIAAGDIVPCLRDLGKATPQTSVTMIADTLYQQILADFE